MATIIRYTSLFAGEVQLSLPASEGFGQMRFSNACCKWHCRHKFIRYGGTKRCVRNFPLTASAVTSQRIDQLHRLCKPDHTSWTSQSHATEETRDWHELAAVLSNETVEDAEISEYRQITPRTGVPVFVMLPLDTVWVTEKDGRLVSQLKREQSLDKGLEALCKAGVEGVMVDVWWGLTERAPHEYDFSAYANLFEKIHRNGLKVQAVMSFHAAGDNVGDTCQVPLPAWVMEVGEIDPDIWYTDSSGIRNRECLSLGCDKLPIFHGRTPVQCYHDFISAFSDQFHTLFGMLLAIVWK